MTDQGYSPEAPGVAGCPTCPYCGKSSVPVDGGRIYPNRPALANKRFFLCDPCRAWVGCHEGSNRALGSLADAQLRSLRSQAHVLFDPLWRPLVEDRGWSRSRSRQAAYRWLAWKLGLAEDECHIGMFDEARCLAAIEALRTQPPDLGDLF